MRSLPCAASRFFAARMARSRVPSDFTAGVESTRSTAELSHDGQEAPASSPTLRTKISNRLPQSWQEYS